MQEISSNTFIPPHPLKTAVLFLVFNRPDTTKQVFEAIRKAKPPRLYVLQTGRGATRAARLKNSNRRAGLRHKWNGFSWNQFNALDKSSIATAILLCQQKRMLKE